MRAGLIKVEWDKEGKLVSGPNTHIIGINIRSFVQWTPFTTSKETQG